ncbi:hypothetical protein PHYSODRAFT_346597 [Phytophthora sojae]|uniref:Dienelactone hydrolase domain-containing protein n=1 Tax=Phytophthora sojae (strain P6497) TaxID=1094619 RepID=G4ZPF0_PHYSP|nr:hypothetical protein PHYSODRAFT_346597 [Phytophthora sojae]EGZ15484.1 hypothetical protein PHYSODRAFT_346597 [Phytophthora sojae]|eukprot:XP_009529233.1 hypothetical protein PHYSODRAFT_346597 [Phytophthora sojae]
MAVTRRISLKKTKVAKPKKTYKQWTESDLLRAMTAVKNHQLSLNGAKRVYGNQFKMTIAANLFVPKVLDTSVRAPAIIVGNPMGAVKEQSTNLYATKLAEQGFVTISTFSAVVDYLTLQDFIDPERIGALGICGSGSFAISASKIDHRIKAAQSVEQRKAAIASATQQCSLEAAGGERASCGECTPPGFSRNVATHPTLSSNVKSMNFYPFDDIDTISSRPLLFVSGDQAHSPEFGKDAYAGAAEPKKLYWVPGAGHVDLYVRVDLIPFAKFVVLFQRRLASNNTTAQ